MVTDCGPVMLLTSRIFFHNKVMFPFKITLVYDEPAYHGANNFQLSSYYISVPDFPELLAL